MMRVSVERKDFHFLPDSGRIVARYLMPGEERTSGMVRRILTMTEPQVYLALEQTLRNFAGRHRNITRIFYKHCTNIEFLIERMGLDYAGLSDERKMLIGSYCTMEYSIESAAFFNPSIMEDFDQTHLRQGEKRILLSFRATGEGHISSIVFRRGILDKNNDLQMMPVGSNIDQAEVSHKKLYNKERFIKKLAEMKVPEKYSEIIMQDLPERFEYDYLKRAVSKILTDRSVSAERQLAFEEMTWLVDSFYGIQFQHDSDISERVIFPISESESNGMEDARFVRFKETGGHEKIYATFTAYNGHTILPKVLSTEDFYTFRIMPLHGKGAQNKNLALFPEKVKGKYAMLARIDGVNNYLMYSDRVNLWNDPQIIQKPKFAWELMQIGNCGSPIKTEEGWLVITHGVGPMRRYSIGASLLDLDDPSKEIGRLKEPMLSPLENEREGYVPNVVYSCGSLIHNNSLILPYGISDYSSSYAVVDMPELLDALKA